MCFGVWFEWFSVVCGCFVGVSTDPEDKLYACLREPMGGWGGGVVGGNQTGQNYDGLLVKVLNARR